MPWKEPGQQPDQPQDPWGNKRDQSQPPDLDKIIAEFMKKVRGLLVTKKPGTQWSQPSYPDFKMLGGIVVAVLLLLWFISGLFIVNPAEEAVVLRLGKYHEELSPGLHWYARFIDTKYLIDIQKIYSFSLQGDFLTKSSEQSDLPEQYIQPNAKKSINSLDQSKNLVNVELNVQYRISNARAYLFNAVNPDTTIQEISAGALSDVIGTMKLDEVLTTGRELLSSSVFDRVKKLLSSYQIGIEVVAVTLKKVQAPDQVKAAFNDVNRADQDKSTLIQQAQAYASKIVPLAQGEAARTLADATAYQQKVVLTAQANVARYQALLQAYLGAPEVTRERMYLETMQSVLQKTTKVLVDVNSGNNLIYLPLDKILQSQRMDNLTGQSGETKHDAN